MPSLSFSSNWNGKLFLDHFGTVRLHNPSKYCVGNQLKVELKSTELGIVKVAAIRTFSFKNISDVLSYLDTGRPAHYLAQLVQNFYARKINLTPDTQLDHVICAYVERYLSAQQSLLKEWWDLKISQQPFIQKENLLFQ